MMLIILGIWILNFGISYWNAYAVGKSWVEARHAGGWTKFMVWMGAIMSASGFTWCYLLVLALIAYVAHWLKLPHIEVMLSLGYIIIIPGILFSGLMITVDSWARAYRNRDWKSVGVAGWNTFAQSYNTYHAVRDMGMAWGKVFDFFLGGGKSSSGKGKAGALIILLVILAIIGGTLTTVSLIHRYAATEPLEELSGRRS